MCSDAFLANPRRAEAVSATANLKENSKLDSEVLRATLPERKASPPGRLRRQATLYWRSKGKGAAVARAEAIAAVRAGSCYALSAATDTSRSAFCALSMSPFTRRRSSIRRSVVLWDFRAPAWSIPPRMIRPSGRHGCPGPESSSGGALSSAERPAGGAPPYLARAGVDGHRSPVDVCPPPFPRKTVTRRSDSQ